MKITYYKTPDGYVALTTRCPHGFQDVVFVGRGPKGGGPETVCEQGFSPSGSWVPIPAEEVPDEWFEAFGYEERPEPKAGPKPADNRYLYATLAALGTLFLYIIVRIGIR